MSAVPQFRAGEGEEPVSPEVAAGNPLHLLRAAIAGLNAGEGDAPDEAQLAKLLAETHEALERAKAVAHAMAECDHALREHQFEKAWGALDTVLAAYPGDASVLKRRRLVEEQERAYRTATAVRSALEEVEWLMQQNRPDLAAHFLKEKTAERPDQTALRVRLEEIEALQRQWEQDRYVQAALSQAEALERQQQWQAALTILEGALHSYPAARELTEAAIRVRDQLFDHEQRRKLARRLELIRQRIAEQSWKQALTILEQTQREFPDAAGLDDLQQELDAGLRRADCDAVVTEVRQHLADGNWKDAEEMLRLGLESLGSEPALEELRAEVEAGKTYREGLRRAQLLLGRHELLEAEQLVSQLAAPDRPEAKALLDTVRKARAAAEEEKFFERGREKALKLVEQQQFAAGADLLRNLLLLFPGNAILERDLAAAQSAAMAAGNGAGPAEEENEDVEAEAPPEPEPPLARAAAPGLAVRENRSRLRRATVVGAASIALVSGSAAGWKLAQRRAPVPSAAPARPALAQVPAAPVAHAITGAAPPVVPIEPAPPAPIARKIELPKPIAEVNRTRPFVPPDGGSAPVATQAPSLPLPPGTVAIVTTPEGVPSDLLRVNAPAPPPPASAPPAPAPAPVVPTAPSGGVSQSAQLVERTMPVYPDLARQRGIGGTVRLEAQIDEHGAVTLVTVVKGDPILAAAAQTAVKRWKYRPATLNGRPVASSAIIQFSFDRPNK